MSNDFTAITTVGGLLPVDLLVRVAASDPDIPGIKPTDYGLVATERTREAIARSWNRLSGLWQAYEDRLAKLPEDDPATTPTRELWMLPLLQELCFDGLAPVTGLEIEGDAYPISHMAGVVPIHILGAGTPLDVRTRGRAGAARLSPHALTQEFLNRSDEHLWAIVTNGRHLRVLRDSTSLTKQAYLEFDLEAMFSEGLFADFTTLWMTLHGTRFVGERPEDCLLEQWLKVSHERGVRALDHLRDGVEKAIERLGTGFISHPGNGALRERLRSGELDAQDYYRQLLRVVYRMLFLLVAEERGLLHPPDTTAIARQRYDDHYSITRLRRLAERRRGTAHSDRWEGIKVVTAALGGTDGLPALGLPALGSMLWSTDSTQDLSDAYLSNVDLLVAMRSLAFAEDPDSGRNRRIDYRNMGTEELGSVYEGLLECSPEINLTAASFRLMTAEGNERRLTGSYYTPSSLIFELLRSSLNTLLDEAVGSESPEAALLNLRIVDPACGSGHFLIAAANRISIELARARTGEFEPAPEAVRHARRDVIGHCIYGIDLNPMAVELCKVALWMESVEPGQPLGFLDNRIVQGNALIGATPALIAEGIPDAAFNALEGDDRTWVTTLRKQNRRERAGANTLFVGAGEFSSFDFASSADSINTAPEDSAADVARKEERWNSLVASPDFIAATHEANTWCAAFFAPKVPGHPPITQEQLRRTQDAEQDPLIESLVRSLSEEYSFFHWHLAFPDVHARGGFDLAVGNPPWEKIKLSEKEFFASRDPDIAAMSSKKRKPAIHALQEDNPSLFASYRAAKRRTEAFGHFVRESGRFPLCGRGDVNTYSIFAETMRDAIGPEGMLGVIVPTGIATDDTTRHFFADLIDRKQLVSLFDFENVRRLFPGIATINRFCLLTLTRRDRLAPEISFFFFAHTPDELGDQDRRYALTPEDLRLINPNTLTAPVFRSRRDAEITRAVFGRLPVLIDERRSLDPWGLTYQLVFHMSVAASKFQTQGELTADGAQIQGNVFVKGLDLWLPLYEAKMMHQYNHRDGDYAKYDITEGREVRTLAGGTPEELQNPGYVVQPRYWVAESEFTSEVRDPKAKWLLGFRDVTNTTTNRRTLVATAIPPVATGHKLPLLWVGQDQALLLGCLNSLAADYVARQKISGSNMTWFVMKQLAIPTPEMLHEDVDWAGGPLADWLTPRLLELVYTSWDLYGFALDLNYSGQPFRWDDNRRSLIRAEIDAAFFWLYGLDRSQVVHILDSFEIIERKEMREVGEYRTKRLSLERFDAISSAIAEGAEYETALTPPPADASCAHHNAEPPVWLDRYSEE